MKLLSDVCLALIVVCYLVGCGIAAAVPDDETLASGVSPGAAAIVVVAGGAPPVPPATTALSSDAAGMVSRSVSGGADITTVLDVPMSDVSAPPTTTTTTTAPIVTTTTSSPPNRALSYRDMIAGWFPQWAREEAWRVMMCESGGDPDAHGDLHIPHRTDGLGSVGLFQINAGNIYGTPMHAVRAWQTNSGAEAVKILKDPATNVQLAYLIWKASGETFRRHWVNCTRGR